MRLLVTTLLACSTLLHAKTLSLGDVVNISLENNPNIKVAQASVDTSEAILTQARSSYYPQLTLEGGVSFQHQDGVNFGLFKTDDEEGQVVNASVNAQQLIFDFGKRSGTVDTSKYSVDAASQALRQTKSDVILAAFENYYNALKAYQLIKVAEEAQEITAQQLYRANEYFKAGVKTKIDVTNAQVENSNAKLDLIQARHNFRIARVNLQNVMGTNPEDGSYTLEHEQVDIEKLIHDVPALPLDSKTLVETAYEQRPEIKLQDATIMALESSVDATDSEYYPSIVGTANYNYYDSDEIKTLSDSYSAGVYLNWDFFSGFSTVGLVEESRSQVVEAEAQMQKLRLDILKEVENAYIVATQEFESIEISNLTVQLAKENLEQADERYKSGIGDVIEYNDAQVKYTEARTDFVITYYDYLIALANIKHAIGDFDSYIQE